MLVHLNALYLHLHLHYPSSDSVQGTPTTPAALHNMLSTTCRFRAPQPTKCPDHAAPSTRVLGMLKTLVTNRLDQCKNAACPQRP